MQISNSGMHRPYFRLIWRFGHEFGHGMQTKCYSGEFGIETTVNIYTAFTLAYFCGNQTIAVACKSQLDAGEDLQLKFDTHTKPALAAGMPYQQMYSESAWAPLGFWMQLIATFGYEPIRNMHRRMREMLVSPLDTVCNGRGPAKFDAVYEILCETTGYDLTAHFDKYKVAISSLARKRVASKNYKQPLVDISIASLAVGTPFTWNPQGPTPSYALSPFSSFADAQ
jgi:hypothetical protein